MGDVGSGSLLPGAAKKPGVASPETPAFHGSAAARSAAAKIQARFRKFMDDRDKRRVASQEGVARDPRGGGGGAHHVLLGSDDESSDEEETFSREHSAAFDAGATNVETRFTRMRESRDAPNFVKCALLTLCWFGLSTGLAMYNKTLFGARKGGFPAPLLLTSVQFAMQWMLAGLILEYVTPSLRPTRAIDWNAFSRHVAPVGVAMGLDIGLSNLSLVHVTVSFYTLAKTSSILFLLAFAFAIGVEPFSTRLTAAVLVLCLGEVLTVHGETQFNALGATLCFGAAAASGVRWVLSQRVLHSIHKARQTGGLRKSHGVHNPPVMLRVMMPVMCAVVFAFSCFKERWWATLPGSEWGSSFSDVLFDLALTAIGATMALCMSLAEFELVKETSAVTVSVIGTGKDVFTVAAAVLVFNDGFGVENFFGLLFVVSGIAAYNYHKVQSAKEQAERDAKARDFKRRVELAAYPGRSSSSKDAGDENAGNASQGGGGGDAAVAAAQAARDRLAAELGIGAPRPGG
jgi:solute carrier family 35 protein C2